MIIGFLVSVSILDDKVPYSFFKGIEEPYDVALREYGHWYYKEDGIIVLEIGKRVGTCNYIDCTNTNAWIKHFEEYPSVYSEE